MKKILLIDDHSLFAYSLKLLLEESMEVTLDICESAESLADLPIEKFDLLLLDIHLGSENGIDVGKQLISDYPKIKIVFLSGYDLKEFRKQAASIGAYGFFNKNIEPSVLISSIQDVMDGKTLLEAVEKNEHSLTPKEVELLQYLAKGYRQKDIAKFLDISIRTVRHHLSAIIKKLDVESTTTAVVEAMRLGIIPIIP